MKLKKILTEANRYSHQDIASELLNALNANVIRRNFDRLSDVLDDKDFDIIKKQYLRLCDSLQQIEKNIPLIKGLDR